MNTNSYALITMTIGVDANVPHQKWTCRGQISQLTFNDCQLMGDTDEGCYYLVHFSQYRPCSRICNDVLLHSINEDRCTAHCPGELFSTYVRLWNFGNICIHDLASWDKNAWKEWSMMISDVHFTVTFLKCIGYFFIICCKFQLMFVKKNVYLNIYYWSKLHIAYLQTI